MARRRARTTRRTTARRTTGRTTRKTTARRTTRRTTARRTTARRTTRRTTARRTTKRATARRTTRRTTARRTTKRRTRRVTSERKYYIMKSGRTEAIFTGRQPRQAALKAATRGFTDIRLRERGRRNRDGTYTVHIFRGGRKKVKVTDGPEWLPSSVWKPVVRKKRVERITRI